jgi:hypothetical protein
MYIARPCVMVHYILRSRGLLRVLHFHRNFAPTLNTKAPPSTPYC